MTTSKYFQIYFTWVFALSIFVIVCLQGITLIYNEYQAGKRVHTDLYKRVQRLEVLFEKEANKSRESNSIQQEVNMEKRHEKTLRKEGQLLLPENRI